jgi:putative membrane protein
MQFLKTLFWVALAIILVLFARENWHSATIRLWGGLEADVKVPVLVLFSFLLGLLPMLALHFARIWRLKRRIEAHERHSNAAHNVPAGPGLSPAPDVHVGERLASDAKAWPAS